MAKSEVTLNGKPVAASGSISWRLQTGVAPFTTTLSVHKSQWQQFRQVMENGTAVDLVIRDSNGRSFTAKKVSILHVEPSSKPSLVTFRVADQRWKWPYKLVARDYNVPKKTGDRTAFGIAVPVETQTIVDRYRYRASSLDDDGKKWTARRALEDVLKQVVGESGWRIDSLPFEEDQEETGLSLQNVILRDQGDAAIARILSFIPGAEICVDPAGTVVVFNAISLEASQAKLDKLTPTWDGEKPERIDRKAIRPKKVLVHYEREVEVLFEHEDSLEPTVGALNRDDPYLENVIPTVDVETEITDYDPETDRSYTKTVPSGTWVPIRQWIDAMSQIAPDDSFKWDWETIRRHWVVGDLDGVLGTRAELADTTGANDRKSLVALRVQALKQHFRQTFRINRRIMERVRDIAAVRVAVLDPVTGARQPASVWGQACVIPTAKGMMVARRASGDFSKAELWRNVDSLPPAGTPVAQMCPGPARVHILDHDLGIFRVEWILSPFGTVDAYIPCNLVSGENNKVVATGDLSFQDQLPMAPGLTMQGQDTGVYLSKTSRMLVMLTVKPSAPNNTRQFHRIAVPTESVADFFSENIGLAQTDGDSNSSGPTLSVFIPPGEATARFGWTDDEEANESIVDLLGLNSDNPNEAGWGGSGNSDAEEETTEDVPGFTLVNGQADSKNELTAHSRATAAEILLAFADGVQGRVATAIGQNEDIPGPQSGQQSSVQLRGSMSAVTVNVAAAPSGKVMVLHEFPGNFKRINRMALLPSNVRHMLLGIVQPGIPK